MHVLPVRGRGGDRKERGKADAEDMVMEMDIDPSTGIAHASINTTKHYNVKCLAITYHSIYVYNIRFVKGTHSF